MKTLSTTLILCLAAVLCGTGCSQSETTRERLPNIIVIFIDDMGYADIGPFGADYSTPNLDRMAAGGMKFTQFLVSAPVCSASRAALVTGCLNKRLDINGAYSPKSPNGLNPNEVTFAELVKQKDYATACIGKWHLGLHPKFLPANQGFDYYFGLPYSNDMWPWHPRYKGLAADDPKRTEVYPPLPLVENTQVIDPEVTGEDQTMLTTRYTQKAVQFIEENKDNPFLIYLPHSMVHVPLYVSDKFKGKSGVGLYADTVMELDWSLGQILNALEKYDLDENTLVIFTSDNGPWASYGDHAGSAAPLRGFKHTAWEGGIREPTLFWWPGKIPAGATCDELASTIDIFPTIAKLMGGELPDHKIDGKDISPLMFGLPGAKSPHEFFAHYSKRELVAIRSQEWKLVFPHKYSALNGRPGGKGGFPVAYDQNMAELALYNLEYDVGESKNVKDHHPEIYEKLLKAAEAYRAELGDRRTGSVGTGVRPVGVMEDDDVRLTW